MSREMSPLDSLTAENNEVLRASRDSDVVDWRIDSSMMMQMLRKTPAERLQTAADAARGLHKFLSGVRNANR
ncbi:MAG TPA: hypothetical protein VGQ46_01620 [Thermoanaerobaculia bacterium]|jgi:hypothetical protein|nr:hypothetical protein [Thermoanaerobaculia bacterium]